MTKEDISKKEIEGQLESIKNIVDNDVRLAVSPDNWCVYSHLYDEIEQLETLLKLNGVI